MSDADWITCDACGTEHRIEARHTCDPEGVAGHFSDVEARLERLERAVVVSLKLATTAMAHDVGPKAYATLRAVASPFREAHELIQELERELKNR